MPLFRAAVERCEDIILRLHDCSFGSASESAVLHASPPVSELARHLMHCRLTPPALACCNDIIAMGVSGWDT